MCASAAPAPPGARLRESVALCAGSDTSGPQSWDEWGAGPAARAERLTRSACFSSSRGSRGNQRLAVWPPRPNDFPHAGGATHSMVVTKSTPWSLDRGCLRGSGRSGNRCGCAARRGATPRPGTTSTRSARPRLRPTPGLAPTLGAAGRGVTRGFAGHISVHAPGAFDGRLEGRTRAAPTT